MGIAARGRLALFAAALGCAAGVHAAPPLSVAYRNGADLPASAVDQFGAPFTIAGLSGLTMLPDGRFAAMMDNSDKVVFLAVAFGPDGSIASATVTGGLRLAESRDFEDIACTSPARNTVWVCEEGVPEVREYALVGGGFVQSLPTPPVYLARRANFGFESLTLDPAGRAMWAANEEALTVDGPASTPSAGTLVRLQRWQAAGASWLPAQQFAWLTQPIHGPTITGARSGVCALVALPDGRLLVLERSFAFSFTSPFQTRLYEALFDGADDVSGLAALSSGGFATLGKRPLNQGSLTNLEGLCLGPALGGGRFVLLGIIDDGDPISVNRLAAFELSGVVSPPCGADIVTSGAADPLSGPDGFITGEDFDGYVLAFFKDLRAAQGWPIADLTDGSGAGPPDGFVTGVDFDRFIERYFANCH